MKTWKLDWEGWENIQRNLGRNMCYYFVDDKSVLKKLKIGNEVTIYNNGNIVTSKPSFTTATKIIVKKPFFKELIN